MKGREVDTQETGSDVLLARLDYERTFGPWPLPDDVTAEYLSVVHPGGRVVRSDLVKVLAEYVGEYESVGEFARALTAQSLMDVPGVDLDGWPFCHVDWDAAGESLSPVLESVQDNRMVRVSGRYYFAPMRQ